MKYGRELLPVPGSTSGLQATSRASQKSFRVIAASDSVARKGSTPFVVIAV